MEERKIEEDIRAELKKRIEYNIIKSKDIQYIES